MSGDALEDNIVLKGDVKKKGDKKKNKKVAAVTPEPTKKVKKVKSVHEKPKKVDKSGDDSAENFVLSSDKKDLTKKEKKKAAKRAKIDAGMPEHLKEKAAEPEVAEPKKKKRKKNKKAAQATEEVVSDTLGYDYTTATERFQEMFSKHKPVLTQLEIDEITVPATSIASSIRPRIERIASLPSVCKEVSSTVERIRKKGTEEIRVLVLVISAERGMDVSKSCVEWQPAVNPVWLFRHGGGSNKILKAKQKAALEKKSHTIGVGTPGRIRTLLEEEILNLDNLELLVIDMDKNVKQMSIMDMKDTQKDIIAFLKDMVPQFKKNPNLKCVLY